MTCGAAASRAASCRATACSCIASRRAKGVFGSGYVTRAPYEVPDPSTKRGYRLCIDFVLDWLVDADVVIARDAARPSVFGADLGCAGPAR